MERKARQALREKVVLQLSELGDEATQAILVAWGVEAGLAEDEAFVEELEGMVQDGLIRWDGTSYSLHSEGRKLVSRVKKKAGKAEPASAEPPAQDHAHPHDHAHAQDHAHPHEHAHAPPPRPRARPTPAPAPPPPKAGLRSLLKSAVKKILGLER